MAAWFGVITTLVGVVVGGLITTLTSFLQLREQRRREKNKLILSKLEEIHKVLSRFRELNIKTFGARGKDAQLNLFEGEIERKVLLQELEMLTGFYASELLDDLLKLQQSNKKYSRALVKTLQERKERKANGEAIEDEIAFSIEAEIKEVEGMCFGMQLKVITSSQRFL